MPVIKVLQTNGNRTCVYRKGIYYKESAHVIMEASRSQICDVGGRLKPDENRRSSFGLKLVFILNQEEPTSQTKFEVRLLENALLFVGSGMFLFFQAFNWLNEAHPPWGGQSDLLRFHQFKRHPKHPHRNTPNDFWPNMGAPSHTDT